MSNDASMSGKLSLLSTSAILLCGPSTAPSWLDLPSVHYPSIITHASIMPPSCISHTVMYQSFLRHASVIRPPFISYLSVMHHSCLRPTSVMPPPCISHASVLNQSSIHSDLVLCSECVQLFDLHKCNLVVY